MKQYTKDTIEFYDKHVEEYFKGGGVVLKNKISKFIKLLPGSKVLDVACGPGHDTDYLTKKGFDCLGIDLSKKMIEFATKKHKGTFEIADFFDLKFNKNSFDGVWCSSTFTHVDKRDLSEVLLTFKKILKKGGILGIIVPENRKRKQKEDDGRIFTMFGEGEINDYLNNAGFQILHSEKFSSGRMEWIFVISKK